METKIFRVHYQINESNFHADFSMDGLITDETKNISAWNRIHKIHPSVNPDEIKKVKIEDLEVW